MNVLLSFLIGFTVLFMPTFGFAQNQTELDDGEIIVRFFDIEGSDIPKGTVLAVVNSPPEKVWEVISNCDKFKTRMGQIKTAKTLKVEGKMVTCKVTIKLPFPLSNLTAKTIAEHKAGPDEWYRKWKLVEGDYKFNTGGFLLTRFKDDPKRTLLRYWVHANPKTIVPKAIRTAAQKGALKRMIKSIRKSSAKL